MEITCSCSWSCRSENWNINGTTVHTNQIWLNGENYWISIVQGWKAKAEPFWECCRSWQRRCSPAVPSPMIPCWQSCVQSRSHHIYWCSTGQVNEFLLLMHTDPINHKLQVPIWRTLFQEEFRFKWLHARVQGSVMQLCSLNMLLLTRWNLAWGVWYMSERVLQIFLYSC